MAAALRAAMPSSRAAACRRWWRCWLGTTICSPQVLYILSSSSGEHPRTISATRCRAQVTIAYLKQPFQLIQSARQLLVIPTEQVKRFNAYNTFNLKAAKRIYSVSNEVDCFQVGNLVKYAWHEDHHQVCKLHRLLGIVE